MTLHRTSKLTRARTNMFVEHIKKLGGILVKGEPPRPYNDIKQIMCGVEMTRVFPEREWDIFIDESLKSGMIMFENIENSPASSVKMTPGKYIFLGDDRHWVPAGEISSYSEQLFENFCEDIDYISGCMVSAIKSIYGEDHQFSENLSATYLVGTTTIRIMANLSKVQICTDYREYDWPTQKHLVEARVKKMLIESEEKFQ